MCDGGKFYSTDWKERDKEKGRERVYSAVLFFSSLGVIIVIEKHDINILISLNYHLNLLKMTLEHINSSQAVPFFHIFFFFSDFG